MLELGILIPPAATRSGLAISKKPTDPGSPTSNFGCKRFMLQHLVRLIFCERRVKVSKPDPPCQPQYGLLDGYQGSVVALAIWPNYPGKRLGLPTSGAPVSRSLTSCLG